MKITKHQQSAVLIETNNKRILIDPGKFCYDDNFKPQDWHDIDILLLTHGHADHCLPEAIKIIYQNNHPQIFGSKWVGEILAEQNIPVEIMEVGQVKKLDDIAFEAVRALHGEQSQMAFSPRETIGFVVRAQQSVYHCSDTLYMKDKPQADVVLVPISGNGVSMGTAEAAIFTKEINPKMVIPIHYDNPKFYDDPKFETDANKLADAMKDSDIKVVILENGESVEI